MTIGNTSTRIEIVFTILLILSFMTALHGQSPGGVSTNLDLWLRADVGTGATIQGDAIGTWLDQSGNARDAIAIGDPTLEITNGNNFNPAIFYDGNDGHNPVTSVNGQYTMFTMSKLAGTLNGRIFASDVGNTLMGYWNNREDVLFLDGTPSILGGSLATTNPHLYTLKREVSGTYTMNKSGNSLYTGASANSTWDMSISAGGTFGEAAASYVSETILYNRALTTVELDKVETYLGIKYGFTLGHNYYASDWNGSTGTTLWTLGGGYDNSIAGIGRDDNSALNQKQSKTINTDQMVTIGLGTIETTNDGNITTFTADKNFLLWGNDGGSTGLQTTELPLGAAATMRLGREWKVSETGSVSNLAVAFDNISTVAFDIELYIDTDGDGDFNTGSPTIVTGGTLVADEVTFSGVNLDDGDVFTLGFTQAAPGGDSVTLRAWYKADDGISTAAQWFDASGNTHNMIGVSDPAPVAAEDLYNFNPAVDFDGNDYYYTLDNLGIFGTNEYTIFAIQSPDAANFPIGSYSSANHTLWGSSGTTANHLYGGSVGCITGATTNTKPLTETGLYTYGRRADTNIIASLNGGVDAIDPNGCGGSLPNTARSELARIRWVFSGERLSYYNGRMSEVIVYNSFLSDADKLKVESYLAIKYGITLDQISAASNYVDSDGTIIWNGTINAAYGNDIAGIGTDEASALNQKQSKSVNDDAIVTIGLGSIEATNMDNTNTFANDKSFLLWGNDDASTDAQSTELPASATSVFRMGREWKVSEAGSVTNLSITFSNLLSSYFDLELFVDTDGDGDFTNAIAIAANSFAGGTVTFIGVDLNDGDVFTLGFSQALPGCNPTIAAWYKADDGISSGAQWNDISGNDNHAPSPSLDPTVVTNESLNFLPSFDFPNNANYYFQPPNSDDFRFLNTTEPDYTFYVVYQADGGGLFWSQQNCAAPNNNFMLSPNFVQRRPDGGSNSSPGNTGTLNIGYASREGTTYYTGANGAEISLAATAFDINRQPLIGRRFNCGGNSQYDGRISEILVYRGSQRGLDNERIHSYLALKYGVTLPYDYLAGDGAVIWANGSGYDNDIAGIGRDDCQKLDKRQSKSVNTDDIITMGLGEIAVDNTSNSNAFAADESFLLWGNDDASTAVINTGIPSSFSEKITRNWLVNETGTVGSTLVQIPNSAVIGFSTTTALMLFVADDSGFTTNLVSIPLIQNGVNWEATVDFDGTKYFTFGIVASGDFMKHGKTFQGGIEQPMKF
ncbi:hypothetical protein [Spongiimicrobium sp. 3-5]|uniref:hypothetical protein n=1 Tax=Spongiimicrobium sp. 3-5 TaxID=3332596 RepID=UPI00397F34A8